MKNAPSLSPKAEPLETQMLLETAHIHHPSFDDPATKKDILSAMPDTPDGKPLRSSTGRTLLSREQEAHLFRQMNYCKFLALREEGNRTKRSQVAAQEWLRKASAIRNLLVECNVGIAEQFAGKFPDGDRDEAKSRAYMALMRAAEKFDFAKGNKFVTYAGWALINDRLAKFKSRSRRPTPGRLDEDMDVPDYRSTVDGQAVENAQQTCHLQVHFLFRSLLDRRERAIMELRTGVGDQEPLTLQKAGEVLGITKERVRQIQAQAFAKLQRFAKSDHMVARSIRNSMPD